MMTYYARSSIRPSCSNSCCFKSCCFLTFLIIVCSMASCRGWTIRTPLSSSSFVSLELRKINPMRIAPLSNPPLATTSSDSSFRGLFKLYSSADDSDDPEDKISNDNDDSSAHDNNNNNQGKKKRVKYDLGLDKNYPQLDDTSSIQDSLVQHWIAPQPVSKSTIPPKSAPYDTTTTSPSTASPPQKPPPPQEPKKRRTSYDVGMGKNPPKMPPIHTQALELTDDTTESKVLKGALWHEGHYTGGSSSSSSVGDQEDYFDTYNYAGSFEGTIDSSIPKPRYLYPDIELSVPSKFYSDTVDSVWDLLRYEAQRECQKEPLLVSFLHSTILNHRSLESALAFHLANKLSSPAMISTQIQSLVMEALDKSPEFRRSLRADIMAVRDRDPACTCLPDVFLYFKGFHALQTHRVAHYMWNSNRRVLSHYLQSQMSQNFQIDIHPNATLGSGIMLDHGTGIVIGETARVGHNCSILHHVTLGGSGKKGVDRHPKIGDGVLLGAGCSILGNIHIGDGCQIGAGTLVTSDLRAHSVAVGVPAKIIGSFVDVTVQPSIDMNQMTGSQEFDKNLATFESEGI